MRRKGKEKREKEERKWIRKKKEELKTKPQLIAEAQREFNKFIRERDKGLPCISCGRDHGGQYHAGHYRTTKAAPQLRFNELNCHKQCAPCNNHKSGDIVNFRASLIDRIGLEGVELIESNNDIKRWSEDELKDIKDKYKRKTKQLKEALEVT